VQKLLNRIKKIYKNPDEWLPHLRLTTPKCRKKRTERVEAVCRVLGAGVYLTDLGSLQVGVADGQGRVKSLTVKTIAKYAKLSYSRTKRAIKDLIKAKYFESDKVVKRHAPNVFESFPSIKKLTRKLFYHLKITENDLRKNQAFKRNKHRETLAVIRSTTQLAVDEMVKLRDTIVREFPAKLQAVASAPKKAIDFILSKFKPA
jgi:hypothetical protein